MLAAAALALGAALPALPPPALAAGVPPIIVSVFPKQGQTTVGAAMTITGANFITPMVVTFGGASATSVVVKSETTLTCVAPAHAAGDVDVVVAEASDPVNLKDTAVNAFHYNSNTPCYVWVPRALGAAPGGFDVSIVDVANRREAGVLDVNFWFDALEAQVPAANRTQLPADDQWQVTQVLFEEQGTLAFLATAGVPGTSDSGAVFVVSTAVVVGDRAGIPLVGLLPGAVDPAGYPGLVGNPYQLAFSPDHLTLFAADGGSWDTPATASPDGNVLSWSLKDLASAVTGTTANLKPPAPRRGGEVGRLPVLSYDRSTNLGWGTNSSFKGIILDQGGFTAVASAYSQRVSRVRLSNLGVGEDRQGGKPFNKAGVAIEGADTQTQQVTTVVPSPFDGDLLFVETSGEKGGTPVTDYFVYRLSSGLDSNRVKSDTPGAGKVWKPVVKEKPAVRFRDVPGLPDLRRFMDRVAWPHPDAPAIVAIPEGPGSLVSWDPATGVSTPPSDPTGFPPPATPSASLAYNDASGFLYARNADGSGWTVFQASTSSTAPSDTCPGGAVPVDPAATALEPVLAVSDATGADSLRVVGDGSSLVGTTSSSGLVVIEGRKTLPSVHTVVGPPIPLALEPLGGPVFPQPGANCGAARTFPQSSGTGSLVRITGPTGFDPADPTFPPAALADPKPFTGAFPEGTGTSYFLELGTQFDFLPVPGSLRMRVRYSPDNGGEFKPSPAQWRRLLMAVSSIGLKERPFYARLVSKGPRSGRSVSPTACYHVRAGAPPVDLAANPSSVLSGDQPPVFEFDAGDSAETADYFVEVATVKGPSGGTVASVGEYAATPVVPDDADPDYSADVPAALWKQAFDAAVLDAGLNPAYVQLTVRHVDGFGRVVRSDPLKVQVTP
jgi:hypothetical protein